ncbi:MAG: Quinone-interacting membrane-bound oxidoreductase complex subunit C [Candidatus Magnetoglobus multicellularis str. Araruama]|uniref:Quinone-interacting membrane-bound oxidoreductase complex subunit C n=1 Tax=Candidatus Magnetoglobus multicellularis str. Araruama TaxID=890399 RepID=A0A1V1PFM7_9BACT|nr:MAG: Quinone-interacting membrane-bound oxidoreductase complex subunit C [Candidatus Magnetoglobus multicellularis str. Araruama]
MLLEPDVKFIKELESMGGDSVKKCFQCATCSVACPISPDNKPFPRKEMIATSWGLKDRVIKNADIWLCHNCGDCSTLCPRGAKPGDVLAALRMYAIKEYAYPKQLGEMVNDPSKLPILLAVPVIIFLIVGMVCNMFVDPNWLNFSPGGHEIVHSHFFSTWLVDLIFVPLALCVVAVFARGGYLFLNDIHQNAVAEGKTDKKELDIIGIIQTLPQVILKILRHDKFDQCGENQTRSTPHMLVLFGFIGLFIVTNIFFVVLYGFGIHGPYSQFNPVKWLANISGIFLAMGGLVILKERISQNTDLQTSTYKDWLLIGLVLALAFSGLLTEMTRLGELPALSYIMYFIHLVFVFCLFAYVPFSKLAHLFYRTLAMTYAEYANRK